MKAVLISDQHFGVKNDSKQMHDYFHRFYSEIFFPYIDQHDIKDVFVLGDLVDRRKYINYITLHRLRKDFVEPLVSRSISVHIIVGNHDCSLKNTNDINAIQELFGKYPVDIYSGPETINWAGTDILMLPWITNDNYQASVEAIESTPAQVVFGHLELAGFELLRGITSEHGQISVGMFDRFDSVVTGHYHHRSTKGNIHYLGSPYETTWADYNDPRGFHVFDSTTRELTFISNPITLFSKIVYNDDKKQYDEVITDVSYLANRFVKIVVERKTNPFWFDKLYDAIQAVNPYDITIIDEGAILEQLDDDFVNEAEDTLTILRKYVDSIDTPVDKNRVNSLLTNLYSEAQHMVTA